MTIAEFYDREGLAGLRRLADQAGTDLSYIRALLYSKGKNPSLKMAIDLVEASGGLLTYVGLAYPTGRPSRDKPAPAPAAKAKRERVAVTA